MRRFVFGTLWMILFLFFFGTGSSLSHAFTAQEVARLKDVGVDDATLKYLIENQADLLGLVDVEGIVRLKRSGVGNDVIRALATPRSVKHTVRTYGTYRVDRVRSLTAEALVRLKQEGFNDDLLKAVVEIQRRDLWPVLVDVGLIDCRGIRR